MVLPLHATRHVELLQASPVAQKLFIESLEAWYATMLIESREVSDVSKAALIARHEILKTFDLQFPGELLDIIQRHNYHHVGEVWAWPMNEHTLRIGFIRINERLRRNGFAYAALSAIEKNAHSAGYLQVRLAVFSHLHSAINLYQKLGYETISQRISPITNAVSRHELKKSLSEQTGSKWMTFSQ